MKKILCLKDPCFSFVKCIAAWFPFVEPKKKGTGGDLQKKTIHFYSEISLTDLYDT